jgi:UDP-N-acetylmuramate--alanine ligase
MEIDFSNIKKVFFVGIGGIGISAIARMMLLQGKEVVGSDMSEGEVVRELRVLGAQITIGQGFEYIPTDADLIVYTIAIKHYDPKLMEQISLSGIIAKSYPEMLTVVTKGKYTIAVSGTHGKTTTTAMIAKILIEAKKDPSVIVGSLLKEYSSNLIVGKSEYFVVEACEYERSFLNIHPKILVITNIEADHLDYYKDLADIVNAFKQMTAQTESVVVCDPNEPAVVEVLKDTTLRVVDYTAYISKVPKLKVPGEHNRKNAGCALAVADIIGIEEAIAHAGIAEFAGTWRRLENKGTTANGTIVYDDYAHHPTEVRASLEALRELYPKSETNPADARGKKITVLFQPHLYSRTKALFEEFVTAFLQADAVYFLPIYFAREEPDPTVSSELLASRIPGAKAFTSFEEAQTYFAEAGLNDHDVLVTMGAGEAYKIGDSLLK